MDVVFDSLLPESRRQKFHLQIFEKCQVQAISY